MPTQKQIEYFKPRAVWLMSMLMRDFPTWGIMDAAADAGNAGHESGGFSQLQELKPTVAGSRGGFGWYQWTGPRRVEYEGYCTRNGYNPRADLSNYKFHFLELKGPEAKTVEAVARAHSLDDKVRAFEQSYERAGVKHYESRIAWAKIALEAWQEAEAAGTVPNVSGEKELSTEFADVQAAAEKLATMPLEQFNQFALALSLANVIRAGIGVSAEGKGNMDQKKGALSSMTIWGGLAVLAPFIGQILGVDIGADELQSNIENVMQGIGGLLAIFGRIRANSRIGGLS